MTMNIIISQIISKVMQHSVRAQPQKTSYYTQLKVENKSFIHSFSD